jgi:hypothetical protein
MTSPKDKTERQEPTVDARDQLIRQKLSAINMLKDHSYTPKNVVLVTVDDLVELFHQITPYTMNKLDEVYAREKALLDRLEAALNAIEAVESNSNGRYNACTEMRSTIKAEREKLG